MPTKYKKRATFCDQRSSTALIDRVNEHQRAINALEAAKQHEAKMRHRLVSVNTGATIITTTPAALQRWLSVAV